MSGHEQSPNCGWQAISSGSILSSGATCSILTSLILSVYVKACAQAVTCIEDGQRLTAGAMQGGYFVINGSEKVLIAQERMANNHVYVFRKSQPSKFAFTVECRHVAPHVMQGAGRAA